MAMFERLKMFLNTLGAETARPSRMRRLSPS